MNAAAFLPHSRTMAVRTFLRNAGSRVVSVTFRKEDGSLRTMQFNPRDRQEIKGTGTAALSADVVRCRDFRIARTQGAGAWRSFRTDRVVSLRTAGVTLTF
jgi:hypothetical protein